MTAPVLSIIVPVKDEAEAVPVFISAVKEALDEALGGFGPRKSYEIIFVDDGSTDSTLAILLSARLDHPEVKVISFSRNFGKEAALSAGLDHATGAAAVPMDVDLQDPPELLGPMVAKWLEGYDVVYGVRAVRDSDSRWKRLTADWFYRAHNWVSADKIPAHAGDFRLMDRRVVDVIKQLPERSRFMKGLFAWAGFRQVALPYVRPERTVGSSKWRYWKLWNFALDGITSSSTLPLRAWTYIGAAVALGAFGYAAWLIVRTLALGSDVPGYASLMVVSLLLGGINLVSLGVLGEYVGRIFTEVKGRPLYVVRTRAGLVEPHTPENDSWTAPSSNAWLASMQSTGGSPRAVTSLQA
jgi:glycosyltransferase involved in cell wall biosynthesis